LVATAYASGTCGLFPNAKSLPACIGLWDNDTFLRVTGLMGCSSVCVALAPLPLQAYADIEGIRINSFRADPVQFYRKSGPHGRWRPPHEVHVIM